MGSNPARPFVLCHTNLQILCAHFRDVVCLVYVLSSGYGLVVMKSASQAEGTELNPRCP